MKFKIKFIGLFIFFNKQICIGSEFSKKAIPSKNLPLLAIRLPERPKPLDPELLQKIDLELFKEMKEYEKAEFLKKLEELRRKTASMTPY